MTNENMQHGLIIKAQSVFFTVETGLGFVICQLRGKLKRGRAMGDIAALGDKVLITVGADGSGSIEEVEERKGGLALVLLAFGRWNSLGWKAGEEGRIYQKPLLGEVTASQRGVIKCFLIVGVLVFVQGMLGSLVAHYRADPASFYGIDLSSILAQ